MAILGLHHAHVCCPLGGEAEARRFYSGKLGLPELPRPADLGPGLWFGLPGGAEVHISAETDVGFHKRRHFALKVDDVDAMRRALEAQGVPSEDAVAIPGVRRCYVNDPFGNKIELHQIG
jgi:catechol 2,3-dioxygenase-like lactoylglutathione lyase family enzyme